MSRASSYTFSKAGIYGFMCFTPKRGSVAPGFLLQQYNPVSGWGKPQALYFLMSLWPSQGFIPPPSNRIGLLSKGHNRLGENLQLFLGVGKPEYLKHILWSLSHYYLWSLLPFQWLPGCDVIFFWAFSDCKRWWGCPGHPHLWGGWSFPSPQPLRTCHAYRLGVWLWKKTLQQGGQTCLVKTEPGWGACLLGDALAVPGTDH